MPRRRAEKKRRLRRRKTGSADRERGNNPTELFIEHLAGNDCVDLFFEKCTGCRRRSGAAPGSRRFLCVFVDVYSSSRHS